MHWVRYRVTLSRCPNSLAAPRRTMKTLSSTTVIRTKRTGSQAPGSPTSVDARQPPICNAQHSKTRTAKTVAPVFPKLTSNERPLPKLSQKSPHSWPMAAAPAKKKISTASKAYYHLAKVHGGRKYPPSCDTTYNFPL